MGGGEVNLYLLAKSLVASNIDVTVLTSYHPGLKEYEVMDGIHVHRTLKTGANPHTAVNNLKRMLLFPTSCVREVRKICKAKMFDSIHLIGTSLAAAPKIANLNVPLFATIESYISLCPKGDRIYHGTRECKTRCFFNKFLRCQRNSPEIGKMHNAWYLRYNPLTLPMIYLHFKRLRRALKYCKLIAISEYIERVLIQHKQKSIVIPNSINIKDFTKTKQKKKIKKQDRKRSTSVKIICMSALIKSKGPQTLLRSLEGLETYSCTFYGDGPLEEEIKRVIKLKGLNAKVLPFQPYSKVPEIYQDADIVVFPSIWPEPFGRIALEAMAAGTVVVGSNIGGIAETLKETGILIEPGNHEELHRTLKKLIAKPVLRKKIGKKGIKCAKAYEEKKIVQKLIATYKKR